MSTSTVTIVLQILGLFVTVSSAAWVLSQKLERLKILFEGHTKLMDERMKTLDREIGELRDSIRESRDGRVQLWTELNNLRDRATRIETQIEGGCEG